MVVGTLLTQHPTSKARIMETRNGSRLVGVIPPKAYTINVFVLAFSAYTIILSNRFLLISISWINIFLPLVSLWDKKNLSRLYLSKECLEYYSSWCIFPKTSEESICIKLIIGKKSLFMSRDVLSRFSSILGILQMFLYSN